MSGERLLDSNIIIDIFRGDKQTIRRVEKIAKVYVPIIVIGELVYGANKSSQIEKEMLKIERLENKVILLDCDKNTAIFYGEIKNELRRRGTLIPENDIWIAAVGKQYEIKIITKDNHFDKLEGLVDFEKW